MTFFATRPGNLARWIALGLLALWLPVASCGGATGTMAATTPATTPKYPRRKPGCKLTMYSSPKPGVAAWDDLGVAEVGCHLDTSKPQCLAQLRAEACRMGGDIIYDIPAKPRRPYEQAMVYRARVAHTRTTEGKPEREKEPAKPGEEPPPPATEEESAGPVIPLGTPEPKKKPKPAPPPAAPDGGAPEAPPSRFF